jgi:hypothetical protein
LGAVRGRRVTPAPLPRFNRALPGEHTMAKKAAKKKAKKKTSKKK